MRRVRPWLKACQVVLIFMAGLAAVGLAFPFADLMVGRYAVRARERVQVAWYAALLRVLGVRVRTHGAVADEASLWVSNHISWLDIVVLGAHRPLTFVAKGEVGHWPVVGYMARRTGTLLVRRGDARSSSQVAERMTWLLRQRRRVALFPEGTSSRGDTVLRFHARLMAPAVRVGAPVQPVAIAYRGDARGRVPFVGDDDFLPHLWNLLGEPVIDVELSFCRPVAAGTLARDRLAEWARTEIVGALTEVSAPAAEPGRLRAQS